MKWGNQMLHNSIYLMMATAVMAGLGFFFWILASRLFSAEMVGLATTLISVTSLVTSFSLLGLDNGLIRYLPKSENKNSLINTALTITGLTSVVITVVYLIFIHTFTPRLLFIRESPVMAVGLVLFTTCYSLNSLFEGVFTALRKTVYVLAKNTIFSVVKLVLPVMLVAGGAFGLYMSFGIATVAAVIMSILVLMISFGYKLWPEIHRETVKMMAKFSLGNYLAVFIGGLPALSLPILITNSLGEKFSAFFYIDMMIANLLFIIPIAVAQSLFAEGSHDETVVGDHQKQAVKMIAILLIPAILVIVFFGQYILLAFGKQYSAEGDELLRILAVSGIFVAVTCVGDVILKLKHQVNKLIIIKVLETAIILGLSFVLRSGGLNGIGTAWMIGTAVTAGIYIGINRPGRQSDARLTAERKPQNRPRE